MRLGHVAQAPTGQAQGRRAACSAWTSTQAFIGRPCSGSKSRAPGKASASHLRRPAELKGHRFLREPGKRLPSVALQARHAKHLAACCRRGGCDLASHALARIGCQCSGPFPQRKLGFGQGSARAVSHALAHLSRAKPRLTFHGYVSLQAPSCRSSPCKSNSVSVSANLPCTTRCTVMPE